jgi:hypothetical protein
MPGTSRRLDFVPGDWMSKPSRLLCVSRRLSLGENFLKIDPGDWIIIQATGSSFKKFSPRLSRLDTLSRRLSLGENFLKIDPGDWIIIQATGSSFKNSLPDSVAWTHYPGAWIYVF